VKDLQVSDKVTVLDDPETTVAVATFARDEEEVEAVPGAEVAEAEGEPELAVERGKKEEEEGEE
jgi:hypothetical protein